MSAGNHGDTPKTAPQGRPSLARAGHPIQAFLLPRRSIRDAWWPHSEPPAPHWVQAAARLELGSSAAGRRRHLDTAGRESWDACRRTTLRSPRGRCANTERFLDLRHHKANYLGARGGFSAAPAGSWRARLREGPRATVPCTSAPSARGSWLASLKGYDLQLTRYDAHGWHATFYTTGWSTRRRARPAPGGSARHGTRRSGRRGRR